jgi:hypothetical protein
MTTTEGMLREQGAKGEVTVDEANAKSSGRALGTKSGTSMTPDEHIPRKRLAVRDLSAEEAYKRERYLEREERSQREIAEREAANRAALIAWGPTPEEQGWTKRRDAAKKKPPARTEIPPFKLTWEQKEELARHRMNPNRMYGPALGQPTDPDEWLAKRAALVSGRAFYTQNMPLWMLDWARAHELNAREAVDYVQRRIP